MCGRFALDRLMFAMLGDWLGEAFDAGDEVEPIPVRYNVTPTARVPILRLADGKMVPDFARWGLIPRWHKGTTKDWKATTFNARVETVATAPTFREAYRNGRCIVPVSGYYEWQTTDESKRPYYIRPAGNEPALLFAGLYSRVGLEGFTGLTCAVLTEPSTGGIAKIHDRQPVMLRPDEAAAWLAGANIDVLPRLPTSDLVWHEVGREVGSVRNEGPGLILPTP